jgi:macrolide transport system ATP-binding/permease protein
MKNSKKKYKFLSVLDGIGLHFLDGASRSSYVFSCIRNTYIFLGIPFEQTILSGMKQGGFFMLILEAHNIKKTIGDRTLFELPHAKLYIGDRIGIVGKNGAGKTTLLRILAGKEEFHEGTVSRYGLFSYISQLAEEMLTEVEGKLAEKYNVTSQYKETMSGGEKTRLKLAHAFNQSSHLLFADEPTSNLDIEGIKSLEQEMKQYRGAILLISHDRSLLDAVCTKIWEIEDGKINEYEGNYSNYRLQKEEQLKRHRFEYEQYVKEKARLLEVKRQREQRASRMDKPPKRMSPKEYHLYTAKKGAKKASVERAAKVMETRLEKLKKVEKPRELPTTKIDIPDHLKLHCKIVISGTKINKEFSNKILLRNAQFRVSNGKKIALIGNNGSGKTTLLKMILEGDKAIERAHGVKVGYFSQNLDILDPQKTILENVMESSIYSEEEVRTILARLLFKRKDVYKQVEVLSGGERVKVAFAKVFLSDMNVLVMDEPTNYLDIESLEALEQVLKEYAGTVLFVSHDRQFVNELADELLVLENGVLTQYQGTYNEWQQKQQGNTEQGDIASQILKLETQLSDIIGRLSMPSKKDNVTELDKQYHMILQQLKELRLKKN